MFGYINGYNFGEMECQRYYAPPASWDNQKKKDNVRNKIFSGNWFGAEKKDGYFAKFIKDEDGTLILYSRSRNTQGQYVNKIEWVPQLHPFFNELPNGTCLLGELYFPSRPGSKNVTTIMQCLKEKAISRQATGENLEFYVFDILADNGKSLLNTQAIKRFELIKEYNEKYNFDYVHFANYVCGAELWELLQTTLANGDEGIVITEQNAHYEPGKRPSQTTLKVKKELKDTIDCFFTGRATKPTEDYSGKEIKTWKYWQDERSGQFIQGELYLDRQNGRAIRPVTKAYFNHWYGSLEIAVIKDGKIFPIGLLSGLPDEIKADPKAYAMRPIEVTAMEIDYSDNSVSLRHGKMLGWRNDITINECTYEKLMGH